MARRLSVVSESMTVETGTYRWMAPEVILHGKYDHRVDVFSFAIVLWELCSSRLPYGELPPIQAATAVAARGLRPPLTPDCLPAFCPPELVALIENAWDAQPAKRPEFTALVAALGELRARQEPRDHSQLSVRSGASEAPSEPPSAPSDGELLQLQDVPLKELEEAAAAEGSHWASAESGPTQGGHTAVILAQSMQQGGAAPASQPRRRGCGCFGGTACFGETDAGITDGRDKD